MNLDTTQDQEVKCLSVLESSYLEKSHLFFTGKKTAKNNRIFGIKVGHKLTRHLIQLKEREKNANH